MTRRPPETRAEARARRAAVDDPALVLDAAARFVEVRPRAVAEVRRRLVENGYRADLVEGSLERLIALGYLDDAAFARAWVESRDRARPRGARALRDELRRKGVPAAVIEDALAAREEAAAGEGDARTADATRLPPGERAPSDASDERAAAALLARRAAALARETDPRRRRARAYALLARAGFDPDVCRSAVGAWAPAAAPAVDAEGGGDRPV